MTIIFRIYPKFVPQMNGLQIRCHMARSSTGKNGLHKMSFESILRVRQTANQYVFSRKECAPIISVATSVKKRQARSRMLSTRMRPHAFEEDSLPVSPSFVSHWNRTESMALSILRITNDSCCKTT